MLTHERSRSEDGFTLVELLVATTMALIVFAVTLSTLGVFSNASQALNDQNDSQNQARLKIEQIVSQLRNVTNSPATSGFIERAMPDDLVFQTKSVAANVTTGEQVRYCLGSPPGNPSTKALMVQTSLTPITWSTQCPDTSVDNDSVLVGEVTNTAHTTDCATGEPLFTYNDANGQANACTGLTDQTAMGSIRSVGINVFLHPTAKDPSSEYELQSSALLRNAQAAPTASFTWSKGQSASGTVILDGGASYSPSGDSLSYAWSCTTTAGATVPCASSAPTFEWTPSSGTAGTKYNVTLTVTDQAGLQSVPFTSTVQIP